MVFLSQRRPRNLCQVVLHGTVQLPLQCRSGEKELLSVEVDIRIPTAGHGEDANLTVRDVLHDKLWELKNDDDLVEAVEKMCLLPCTRRHSHMYLALCIDEDGVKLAHIVGLARWSSSSTPTIPQTTTGRRWISVIFKPGLGQAIPISDGSHHLHSPAIQGRAGTRAASWANANCDDRIH